MQERPCVREAVYDRGRVPDVCSEISKFVYFDCNQLMSIETSYKSNISTA